MLSCFVVFAFWDAVQGLKLGVRRGPFRFVTPLSPPSFASPQFPLVHAPHVDPLSLREFIFLHIGFPNFPRRGDETPSPQPHRLHVTRCAFAISLFFFIDLHISSLPLTLTSAPIPNL